MGRQAGDPVRREATRFLAHAARGDARARGRFASRLSPFASPAFTLVELLVVIGIMAVMMAIVVPSYVVMSRQNRRATCAANLKAIGQALAMFKEDYGCYPPDSTEFLWTPQAAQEYTQKYGSPPPNYDPKTDPYSLTAAAYNPDGTPYKTYVDIPNPDSWDPNNPTAPLKTLQGIEFHGLGLLTLYYIGAYASVLPPIGSEPRQLQIPDTYPSKAYTGLKDGKGFHGGGYLSNLKVFHCPENDKATYDPTDLKYRAGQYNTNELPRYYLPLLPPPARNGDVIVRKYNKLTRHWDTFNQGMEPVYNNYDQFYRRNFWHWAQQPVAGGDPGQPAQFDPATGKVTQEGWSPQGARNLCTPNPPSDTVVTWCPYHHKGYIPRFPGDGGNPDAYDVDKVAPGDFDLVLFADGTVRRMATRQDGRMYEAPILDKNTPTWPGGVVQ